MCRLLTHRGSLRRILVALACAAAIISGAATAYATDAPVRLPAPAQPSSQLPPLLAPSWPAGWLPLSPIGELFARSLAPVDAGDKGSIYTDGADPVSAPVGPSALELRKLEMAHRAVEASRAAGTLWVAPLDGTPPATVSDSEAAKLRQLLDAPSQPPQPDPAAAVGPRSPVQTPGTPNLTQEERAKLERARKAAASQSDKEELQP